MKIIKPEAHVIYEPHCGLEMAYMAARRCYFDGDMDELLEEKSNASDDKRIELVQSCIKSGHHSILEHVNFTFHITCSRSASHQLVRHRIASYSQQSQRYVKMEDIAFILPDALDSALYIDEDLNRIEKLYNIRIKAGIAPEDARAMLPNCVATHIIMTMNTRQLLHFFEERCCNRAQKEIRTIANMMLENVKGCEPDLFISAGPKCIRLGRCPEHKPCGNTPWKKD